MPSPDAATNADRSNVRGLSLLNHWTRPVRPATEDTNSAAHFIVQKTLQDSPLTQCLCVKELFVQTTMWCVQVPQVALFVVVLATCAVVGAKECVFLHGSGESDFGPPTSTFPGYWGGRIPFTLFFLHRQLTHLRRCSQVYNSMHQSHIQPREYY